ncbi:MAG: hypothetical protein LBP53_03165 [Candidatus Peribacteria bacterium]|jgi:hypothetical protein|nr:hypothetical protein [Candidatus Peribacteria bacterium]
MQIGRMNADWLPARIAQAFHNEHTLRVAFARGEVSLESARKIAQQKGRKV